MQRENSKLSLTSNESDATTTTSRSSRKKISFDNELIQSIKKDDTQVEEFEKWMLGIMVNLSLSL